jgi:trigger factor
LNTSVEKLEGDRVRLSIELDAAEVDGHIAEAYARMARKVRIPGFRSGKAPRPVIDSYLGEGAVLAEALESLVSESYPLALDAEDLRPTSSPDTGELEGLEEGKPYSFTAEFDVRPQLTLSSIQDLHVSVPSAVATDAEVDAQIDYLRDRFASLEVVEDRPVAADDFVLISFVGTVGGEPYEDNVVDRYLYEMGRGGMPPAFDEGLVGAKPGDEVHVEFDVPDTSANAEFVGKTAGFDITVHEIKAKTLPEADDEFASSAAGFDTIAELRDDIKARLDENKSTAHVRLIEREARAELAKRLEGDVPEELVQDKAQAMTEEFFETLSERGVSLQEYVDATGVAPDQIRVDITEQARSSLREELALEALFRQAGLEMTDEEIDSEIERIARTEETEPARLKSRLVSTGVMPLVREQLSQRRAIRWLMDNVQVEDAPSEPAGESEPVAKKGKKRSAKKADAAEQTEAADPAPDVPGEEG